jgi:hypothetical protein
MILNKSSSLFKTIFKAPLSAIKLPLLLMRQLLVG